MTCITNLALSPFQAARNLITGHPTLTVFQGWTSFCGSSLFRNAGILPVHFCLPEVLSQPHRAKGGSSLSPVALTSKTTRNFALSFRINRQPRQKNQHRDDSDSAKNQGRILKEQKL